MAMSIDQARRLNSLIQRACEHEQVRNERAMTQCRPNEPLDRRDEGGFTKFLWAFNFGQADRMEALLAAGCNAAAVTDLGKTGLILAAACGHAALLPWLLERGALLDSLDEYGLGCLHYAGMLEKTLDHTQ